jgi:hypothetical protein
MHFTHGDAANVSWFGKLQPAVVLRRTVMYEVHFESGEMTSVAEHSVQRVVTARQQETAAVGSCSFFTARLPRPLATAR